MAAETDKIVDLADKWGNAVVEAIGRHGPEAVQLAETVARLDAAGGLMTSLTVIGLSVFVGFQSVKALRSHIAKTKADNEFGYDWSDNNPLVIFPGGIFAAGSVVVGFLALNGLLNPMRWAGLFEPKIWIAARLLNL